MYRAVTDLYLNTDHYIVEMKIRIKLAATSQPRFSTPKILKPNLTQWQRYNESVSSFFFFFLRWNHTQRNHGRGSTMSFRVLQTNVFLKRTLEAKKISSPEVLEDLINRRQTFLSEGDHDEVTSLYKQIKKGARADRKRLWVNQFRKCPQVTASEVTPSDHKWTLLPQSESSHNKCSLKDSYFLSWWLWCKFCLLVRIWSMSKEEF